MTTTTTLDLSADVIDVRDIIARFEELESNLEGLTSLEDAQAQGLQSDWEEMGVLGTILEELAGMGGDEQWRGDWYPVTLIRDSHFRDYAEELAYDIGAVPQVALQWPMNCIDWEQAARELRYDYSGVDIDGVTYWTR